MNFRRFWKRYTLELRFGLTSILFWSVLALWVVIVILVTQRAKGITAEYYLLYSVYLFSLAFGSILVATLTIVNASRSQRHQFHQLELSLPVSFEVPFAQYLGNLTLCLSLLILPLIVAALIGSLSSLLYGLGAYLSTQLIMMSLISLIAFWVARRFGTRPLTFFIVFGVWFAFASVPNFWRSLNAPVLTLLSVLRVGTDPYFVNDLYGEVYQGGLYFWFSLFYVGILLVLISAWLQRYYRAQFGVYVRPAWIAVAAGTGLALTGAALYLNLLTTRLQAVDDVNQNLVAVQQEEPLSISTYDLEYRSDGESLFINAEMMIHNPAPHDVSEIPLTLYHTLTVTESNYPFEREGHLLTLLLDTPLAPDGSADVRISYEGPLHYWERFAGTPRQLYFVTDSAVYLPYYAMWYPTIGTALQRYRMGSDTSDIPPIASTPAQHFRLQVLDSSLPAASNLPRMDDDTFYGENVAWVNLYGSDRLVMPAQAPVRLYTSRVYTATPAYLDDITSIYAAYSRYYPSVQIDDVTALLISEDNSISSPATRYLITAEGEMTPLLGIPPVRGQLFLPLIPYHALLDENIFRINAAQYIVDSYWFHLGGVLSQRDLREPTPDRLARKSINDFLWLRYTDTPAEIDESALSPLTQALLSLQREAGDEAVIRVLEQLPRQSDTLWTADLNRLLDWMRAL